MHSKIIEKNGITGSNLPEDSAEIAVKLPSKYCDNLEGLRHLDKTEENALFSYLLSEFFRQIEKHKILDGECISELSFLCESYFDFRDLSEQIDLTDDLETIYTEY